MSRYNVSTKEGTILLEEYQRINSFLRSSLDLLLQ
jgi:hypothetical protein